MKNVGYYNGKIGLIEEMTVPMNDRGVYFGDGIYDACVAKNGIIFGLEDHLNRFYGNLEKVEIAQPMSKDELRSLLNDLVSKVDGNLHFIYFQSTRGTAKRNHVFPSKEIGSNLMITIQPTTLNVKGHILKLISMEDTRFFHCNVKTLNLLPNVMAAQAAKEAGCDETVFHRGERVTECAHSNVSILKDGVLITAPLDNLILPGITRKHMLQICEQLGIPYKEEPYTLQQLKEADEVIVSSTSKLCVKADMLDGQPIGGKDPETFQKIQDAYIARFEKETTK